MKIFQSLTFMSLFTLLTIQSVSASCAGCLTSRYRLEIIYQNPPLEPEPTFSNLWGGIADPFTTSLVTNVDLTQIVQGFSSTGAPSNFKIPLSDVTNAIGDSQQPTGVAIAPPNSFNVPNIDKGAPVFFTVTKQGCIFTYNNGNPLTAACVYEDPTASFTGVTTMLRSVGVTSEWFALASDFKNNRILLFDNQMQLVSDKMFKPCNVPAGFSAYNVRAVAPVAGPRGSSTSRLGPRVYVTYALSDNATIPSIIPGKFLGMVKAFTPKGCEIKKFCISGEKLNAPWGILEPPRGFVEPNTNDKILVGNDGDGLIHVFSAKCGKFLGTLTQVNGCPIRIPRLKDLFLPALVPPGAQPFFTTTSGGADSKEAFIINLHRVEGNFPPECGGK